MNTTQLRKLIPPTIVGVKCELGRGWSKKVWSEWYGQVEGAAPYIMDGRCVGSLGLSDKVILVGHCVPEIVECGHQTPLEPNLGDITTYISDAPLW